MTRHAGARVAALLAAALFLPACASPWLRRPPRLADCPGPLPPPTVLASGDTVWRDRVRYRGGDVDAAFALVAEKRGERLVLVGFDALGARIFSVVQEGGRVEARSRLGRALAVPPENVLRDWYALRVRPPGAAGGFELARAECGYTATWSPGVARPLDAGLSASPSP